MVDAAAVRCWKVSLAIQVPTRYPVFGRAVLWLSDVFDGVYSEKPHWLLNFTVWTLYLDIDVWKCVKRV